LQVSPGPYAAISAAPISSPYSPGAGYDRFDAGRLGAELESQSPKGRETEFPSPDFDMAKVGTTTPLWQGALPFWQGGGDNLSRFLPKHTPQSFLPTGALERFDDCAGGNSTCLNIRLTILETPLDTLKRRVLRATRNWSKMKLIAEAREQSIGAYARGGHFSSEGTNLKKIDRKFAEMKLYNKNRLEGGEGGNDGNEANGNGENAATADSSSPPAPANPADPADEADKDSSDKSKITNNFGFDKYNFDVTKYMSENLKKSKEASRNNNHGAASSAINHSSNLSPLHSHSANPLTDPTQPGPSDSIRLRSVIPALFSRVIVAKRKKPKKPRPKHKLTQAEIEAMRKAEEEEEAAAKQAAIEARRIAEAEAEQERKEVCHNIWTQRTAIATIMIQ